ncbi:MAG: hypothetical protein GC162_13215 [Planctomycetes bacterium]|nr:hypothetical protein [Planctomycetota bacterium]
MNALRAVIGVLLCASFVRAESVPTYSHDIAPIVYEHCASCHRPGEAAPFSLLTYEDAAKRAKLLSRVTGKRYMPPWKAEPSDLGVFLDERHLTDAQIDTFRRWYEAGAPRGDVADLPPMPTFRSGWQLGEPDMVLTMDQSFDIPAEGRDVYRNFVVPNPGDKLRYVKAVEFRPSSPTVVHHAIFFLDRTGRARELDAQDAQAGYGGMLGPGFAPSGGLGGWAVGAQPIPLPEGLAWTIQPRSDLVIQTHFHPSGKAESERSTIGLYFTDAAPTEQMMPIPMISRAIDIPPGEKNYTRELSFKLPVDVKVIGLTPHAHQVCRDMKVLADMPDGTTKTVIHIPDWDFNWQEQYRYADPPTIPAGATLRTISTYDNSADNPRNPNSPPKRITWGPESTDEMLFQIIRVVPEGAFGRVRLALAIAQQRKTMFGLDGPSNKEIYQKMITNKFDADGDGQLSAAERAQAQEFLKQIPGRR